MNPPVQSAESPVPRVSVIIPAYNYAHFLPKAIDSALQQDFKDYEVIVVDDGSTDNTAEVAARYGNRIRYIHQKNAGLPSARNTGIKASRAEFVAFLDADDHWLPEFLTEALDNFARLSPDFAVVASRSVCVDENGQPLGLKKLIPEPPEEVSCRELIFRTRFFPSAVVARRAAMEACGGFTPSLRSSEDRDMWIRVGARYRVFVHGRALVRICRHSSSMSKHASRMKENIRKVLDNAYANQFVPRSDVFFWMRVFSFFYYQCAWMYFEEGRRAVAIGNLIKSILCWPCFFKSQIVCNEPHLFRLRSLIRFNFRGQASSANFAN